MTMSGCYFVQELNSRGKALIWLTLDHKSTSVCLGPQNSWLVSFYRASQVQRVALWEPKCWQKAESPWGVNILQMSAAVQHEPEPLQGMHVTLQFLLFSTTALPKLVHQLSVLILRVPICAGKNFLNKINQESKCACSIHLLCDHEQIKFSAPHFPNWFRNFSVIWQEGNALKYSISDRLLLMIAMEICIGVTYRMIPINLLFYNSIPSIIYNYSLIPLTLGKEER